jgi:adenylylsulfate kinase-like enzyme
MLMTQSRLIVIEGVARAGKSTLARYAGDLLKARGAPHHGIVEGDLNHLADYESVAWLPSGSFRAI